MGVTDCGPPPGTTVAIWTDSPFYEKNDTITINGILYFNDTKPIPIQIFNPQNTVIERYNVTENNNKFNLKIKANFDITGAYYAAACVHGWCDRAWFKFTDKPYSLSIENKTFLINYKTWADVETISTDQKEKSLRLHLSGATSTGQQLILELPRGLIDSKSNGNDANFTVLIGENQPDMYMQKANFTEINATGVSRTLQIDIPYDPIPDVQGIWDIKITGTTFFGDSDEIFLPPLKQFKLGIDPYFITCRQDFQLLTKLEDNSPVCVKYSSTARLLGQGWVNLWNTNGPHPGPKLNEFDGVIIDQTLSVEHVYYFLTNDTSVNNTDSSGVRLVGIDNIDNLNGKHAKIFGLLVQKGEDEIKVENLQILGSLIPKGTPTGNIVQKVSFDDLFFNPDKYYNQIITITGELREYDYQLGIAGTGCAYTELKTSDEFIPDFISRHQLYDGNRYIGVRIGSQDDVGYSATQRLPLDLKNKQVTITGMLVPGIMDSGQCIHILHKSGYVLTDFTKIRIVKN